MRFDWRALCEERSVPFVEQGANVARGNINIACPFCADPSEHMGLSLNIRSPQWGCWRCKVAGLNPTYLLTKLLRIPKLKAQEIVQQQQSPTADEFDTLFEQPLQGPKSGAQRARTLPLGVRQLDGAKSAAKPYIAYLQERGFDNPQELAERYELKYAVTGPYAGRIILPVYREHELVTWVGRSIMPARVRYKTEAGGLLKEHIAHADVLAECEEQVLVITEGPFDFLKVDHYGTPYGLRATCTFGTAYTTPQITKLLKLMEHFRKTAVLFDAEARREGLLLAEELSELCGNVVRSIVADNVKDPGELTQEGVQRVARMLQ